MKTNKSIWAMGGMIAAVMALSGCSAALFSSSSSSDDLYSTHDTRAIANSDLQRRERALAAREAELRRQGGGRKAAYQVNQAQRSGSESTSYQSVLSDNYQDSTNGLKGFSSSSYKVNSTVPDNTQIKAINYASAYDPAVYNVMVMGDEAWVEPKYISSLFGTWGSTELGQPQLQSRLGMGIALLGLEQLELEMGKSLLQLVLSTLLRSLVGMELGLEQLLGMEQLLGLGWSGLLPALLGWRRPLPHSAERRTANRVTAVTALRPDIIRTPAPVQVTAAGSYRRGGSSTTSSPSYRPSGSNPTTSGGTSYRRGSSVPQRAA